MRRSVINPLFRCAQLCVVAVALAACGGDSSTPVPTPVPAPTPVPVPVPTPVPAPLPPSATRVVVSPAGLVLRPGETATLSALVYDQNGQLMTGQVVRWSSGGSAVSIAADGRVTAGSGIDSAQVVAAVGAVTSLPVSAMVAEPAAGARLVPDSDVLVDPAPIDATQTGLPGSRFSVRLAGAAPTVGQIILGSGGKPIAGRVLSSAPASSGGNDVVFATAGLAEIFSQAKIVTRFDGSQLPVRFPSGNPVSETVLPNGEVARLFKVTVPANAVARAAGTTATPGTKATAGDRDAGQVRAAADFRVGSLRCSSSSSVEPNFGGTDVSVTPVGTLGVVESTIIVDNGAAYARFVADGSFGVQLQGSVRVSGQVNGQVKCSTPLVAVPIPVPPQVALIVQPVVPLGFRFVLNGQLNTPGLELKLDGSVRQSIRVGFELQPDGSLENLSGLDTTQLEASYNWDLVGDANAPGFNFQADARAGLFADAALTNPMLERVAPVLDIDPYLRLLEGFAGFNTVARLRPVAAQLANPAQPALYNIKFRGSVGTSATINQALALIGSAVGASTIANAELLWEPTLATTPTGAALASLRKFQVGDAVTLGVVLDPESVKATFLGREILRYNVKRVEVWRKDGSGGATLVAASDATTGETEFSRPWTADRDGELDATYYAFVVPLVGQSFPLLLGEIRGWKGVVQVGGIARDDARGFGSDDKGRVYFAMGSQSQASYRDSATGATITLPAFGGFDTQILRYNAIGSVTGGLSLGGAGDDVPMQMRRGSDGALYAIGNSTASQTGTPVNGFLSAWIAKVDVSGVAPRLVWRRQIGVRNEFAFGMDFGSDGSIFLVSSLSGALANVGGTAFAQDCGSPTDGLGAPDDTADCGDIVVTRMSTDGEVLWRAVDARPGWQREPSIAVRGEDVYVISGTMCEIEDASVAGNQGPCVTNQWLNPDDNTSYLLPMVGVTRIGVAGGTFTRLRSIKAVSVGPAAPNAKMLVGGFAIALDDAGRPVISGTFRRAEAGFVQGSNANPVFLAGLTAAGETAWTRIYADTPGARSLPAVRGLLRAPEGGFYAAFATNAAMYAPGAGGTDVVVLKLAPDGSEQWGMRYGSAGDERAHGLDVDVYGNVFVYGTTTGGFGRDSGFGDRDAFWLKLSSRGQIQSKPGSVVRTKTVVGLPRLSTP
jgi:hypothetical protein